IDVTLSNGMWNRVSIEANGHVLATRTLYVSDALVVSYPSSTVESASHNSRCLAAEYRVQILDSSSNVMDAEGVCGYLQATFNYVDTPLDNPTWDADTSECVYDVVFPATSPSIINVLYFDTDGDTVFAPIHYNTSDTFTSDTADGSLSIEVSRFFEVGDSLALTAYPVDACGVAIPDLTLTLTISDDAGAVVDTVASLTDTASDAVYTYSGSHALGTYTVTVSVDGETAPALTASQPVDVVSSRSSLSFRGWGYPITYTTIPAPAGAAALVSEGTWLAYTTEGTADTKNNVYLYQTDANAAEGMSLQQVIVPGGRESATVPGDTRYYTPVLALSGDVLVIGYSYGGESGVVYIYRHNGSEWEYDGTLTGPDGASFDLMFGRSVHLASEDVLVIGARDLFFFSEYVAGTGWSEIEAIIPPMQNSFLTVVYPGCAVSEGWVFIRCSVTGDIYVYDTSVADWHKTPGYTIVPHPDPNLSDDETYVTQAVMAADMSTGVYRFCLRTTGTYFNMFKLNTITDVWTIEAYGETGDTGSKYTYAVHNYGNKFLSVDINNYVTRAEYGSSWGYVLGGEVPEGMVTFHDGDVIVYGPDRDEITFIDYDDVSVIQAVTLVDLSMPYGEDGALSLFNLYGVKMTNEAKVSVKWVAEGYTPTGAPSPEVSWSSVTNEYTIPFEPPVTPEDSVWVMSVLVGSRLVHSATYYVSALSHYWVDYATVTLPTLSPCKDSEISVVLTNNEGLTVSVDLGDTLTGSWDSEDPVSGVFSEGVFTFTAETPSTSGSHTFYVYVDGVVVGSASTTTAPVLSDEYTYMYLSSDHVVPGANVSWL
ncbi:hypothetical protein KIPB_010292, partial [Kipferlia bialata]